VSIENTITIDSVLALIHEMDREPKEEIKQIKAASKRISELGGRLIEEPGRGIIAEVCRGGRGKVQAEDPGHSRARGTDEEAAGLSDQQLAKNPFYCILALHY
jgi:hypothetical protein